MMRALPTISLSETPGAAAGACASAGVAIARTSVARTSARCMARILATGLEPVEGRDGVARPAVLDRWHFARAQDADGDHARGGSRLGLADVIGEEDDVR